MRLPGREMDAGGHSLDVPLEGAAEALVEVVDIEGQSAVEGGVGAEIANVGVAAKLIQEAGVGLVAEVVRHHRNSATEVAERCLGHACVLDLEEGRQAIGGGAMEDLERAPTGFLRAPTRVAGAGDALTVALPLRLALRSEG